MGDFNAIHTGQTVCEHKKPGLQVCRFGYCYSIDFVDGSKDLGYMLIGLACCIFRKNLIVGSNECVQDWSVEVLKDGGVETYFQATFTGFTVAKLVGDIKRKRRPKVFTLLVGLHALASLRRKPAMVFMGRSDSQRVT